MCAEAYTYTYTDMDNSNQQHDMQGILSDGIDSSIQHNVSAVASLEESFHLDDNQGGGGGLIMTEEQVETLRKQISVYSTICHQLIQMHQHYTSNMSGYGGFGLGPLPHYDSMLMTGNKMNARQRWTPTPKQLEILERMFEQGNGTPSKTKIKEIANELSQYGPISDTNVYNWFQNRRARTKRKQQMMSNNTAESEVESEMESTVDKKGRNHNQEDHGVRSVDTKSIDTSFQCADSVPNQSKLDSQRHRSSAQSFHQLDDNKSLMNFNQLSSYEEGLTYPNSHGKGIGQLLDYNEAGNNYSQFHGIEAYPVGSSVNDFGMT